MAVCIAFFFLISVIKVCKHTINHHITPGKLEIPCIHSKHLGIACKPKSLGQTQKIKTLLKQVLSMCSQFQWRRKALTVLSGKCHVLELHMDPWGQLNKKKKTISAPAILKLHLVAVFLQTLR